MYIAVGLKVPTSYFEISWRTVGNKIFKFLSIYLPITNRF